MSTAKSARTSLLRWIGGVSVAAALTIGGSLVVAAPASAAVEDCPSGTTCLWKDANFVTGGYGNIYKNYANGINYFPNYNWDWGYGNINENVTSVYNMGNSQWTYVYLDYYFNTLATSYPIHSGSPNLGWANDQLSSAGFAYCVGNPSSALCV